MIFLSNWNWSTFSPLFWSAIHSYHSFIFIFTTYLYLYWNAHNTYYKIYNSYITDYDNDARYTKTKFGSTLYYKRLLEIKVRYKNEIATRPTRGAASSPGPHQTSKKFLWKNVQKFCVNMLTFFNFILSLSWGYSYHYSLRGNSSDVWACQFLKERETSIIHQMDF